MTPPSSEASGSPSRGPGATGAGAPPGPDLAALLHSSARGDEAAFAQLYDATAARAYGLAV